MSSKRSINAHSNQSHRHDTDPDFDRDNSKNTQSDDRNTATNQKKKFKGLYEKTTHVHETLDQTYYASEREYVSEKLEFNIIIMGSPRVGKSELINALCDGNQAETSTSLNSCTREIKKYTLKDSQQQNPNKKPFEVHFYDTPGIESWNENAGQLTMTKYIEKVNPLCVIYCASPGSFAKLDQLHSILEYCKMKNIFCALVCTNMYSGNRRYDLIQEFERQLEFFGDKTEKKSSNGHKITFFGQGALCTMINSREYSDLDLLGSRIMPVQGVDEVIHGIMESIDEEKILGWCYAVLYRRTYWEKISQKVDGFFQLHRQKIFNFLKNVYNSYSS